MIIRKYEEKDLDAIHAVWCSETNEKNENSIFIATVCFAAFLFAVNLVLNSCGLQFLKWVKYVSLAVICLGTVLGTGQKFTAKDGKAIFPVLIFQECLAIIGRIAWMVEETHSVLFSNWQNYYDLDNIFVRSSQERIHISYDDYIGDYLYTDYYDENGKLIRQETKDD